MNKRTWAEIDLDALVHNYKLANAVHPHVMPVIKADAYGHGACICAKTLVEAGADRFAVSCMDEALELRQAGIEADILILGYTAPENFDRLIEHDITQTVMSVAYAESLSHAAQKQHATVKVHIKLDTGMARLGLCVRKTEEVEQAAADVARICRMDGLQVEGIFTHFAVSDLPDQAFTKQQQTLFSSVVERVEKGGLSIPVKHCANSGAILNHPDYGFDMVRQGIMLYGEKPDDSCPDIGLRSVMTLKSVVAFCSVLRADETVSYGRTYTADRDIPIAVISVGYADGYRRALSGKGWVSINGCRCPIVGRVCMDQMMVDISNCPQVVQGQEVTVMGGDGPSMTELAEMCDTINYELMCAISVRVPRVYIRDGKIWEVHSRMTE